MQILGTTVEQSDKHLTIILVVDKRPTGQELQSLWTPPEGRLYQEVLRAGLITADGTVIKLFHASLTVTPIADGNYEIAYPCHLLQEG